MSDPLFNLTTRVLDLEEKVFQLEKRVERLAEAAREPRVPEYPEDFLAWYEHYPRKANKKEAVLAWKDTTSRRPALETLIVRTKQFAYSTRNREREYVPMPSSWLRREGWDEDESMPVTKIITKDPGVYAPSPELHLNQQAPDWSHHPMWVEYANAVLNGRTALVFEEWLDART